LVRIPGIPHRRAVKALQKAGFHVVREGKHIVLIVRDAGLTADEFKKLL
jgi:predicted RNA binding protein YcfA (HicA-like mRNA interferase family)